MRPFFALLILTWPRAFRARFGAEMLGHAVEECDSAFDEGWGTGWRAVLGTALDVLGAGIAERLHPSWSGISGGGVDFEMGVRTMMGRWMGDLAHAGRTLRRAPGFTAATVATLALALGVTGGIFGFVDAVLLRPLPWPGADRLVYVVASAPGSDLPEEFPVSREFVVQYEEATTLSSLGAFNDFTSTLRADDRVERLRQSVVTAGFFTAFEVAPVLGRLPTPDDERGVLISHALWTTWFGADPSVLGRSYEFADGPREVIGVMPEDFRFPRADVAAWLPFSFTAEDIANPGRFGEFGIVGRLADGADVAAVERELSALARRLPERFGGSPAYARTIEQHVPVVRPLRDEILGPVSGPLWVLMGAVTLVLLIACGNVAGLFTVRSEGRIRDMAVRRAVGAGRGDLMRAQLAEAVVVAGLAGTAALGIAHLAIPAFVRMAPDGLPRIEDVALSWSTAVFVLLAAAAAALLSGFVPALRAAAPDLARLRDGARGSTRERRWGRDALVAGQTALALVLLVGSGLLLRSFHELRSVDPGFDTEDILTFQFAPSESHLVDGPTWARFHMDAMERFRALPGVEAVGIIENVPLDESLRQFPFTAESTGAVAEESGPRLGVTFAAHDYFAAMGIGVLEGRGFIPDDALVGGSVVLSRGAADLLFPGESPLGRRLRNQGIEAWHTVVGVVEDVRQDDLRSPVTPVAYYPLVGPEPRSWAMTSPGYVIRSSRASSLGPEVRAIVRELAPSAPLYRVYTMEYLVDRSMVQLSFTMLTLVIAAGLALLLGSIGLYGVLSYMVAERTQEIGVRMALGAEAGRVRRMVVRQGARILALGILGGLLVAAAASRALGALLFGVAPFDPWTFGATALAMGGVGLMATYLPARRASLVDPIQSMRGG